ncbi:hypothetical protein NITHO_5020002 [Nitrolancea hollandica Lb]|uniref:Uncharacterized protein n=1 Tax=Nitrolancea hollandica Lb TaxID=1129897 RepID=I4ELE2_9BACT|nr:hypothetical protein NITHO_5020002 [Nitrolancea hollandica Lb]
MARGLLQSAAAALRARLPESGYLRAEQRGEGASGLVVICLPNRPSPNRLAEDPGNDGWASAQFRRNLANTLAPLGEHVNGTTLHLP